MENLGTEESWAEYQKAISRKKSQIKRDKTLGWRVEVSDVSESSKKNGNLLSGREKFPKKDTDNPKSQISKSQFEPYIQKFQK